MQAEVRDEHSWNADWSIDNSLEPVSNVRVKRVLHPEKQSQQRTSTDEGMQIDARDEHLENADGSIHDS
jgi:hypothetical protein